MCYDISFKVYVREFSQYFPDLVYDPELELPFEPFDHVQGVAMFQPHPIIYLNREDGLPHCALMEWGIIEFYRKEEPGWKQRNSMLNIRSERILDDTKSYWHKIRNRRCLVPVSGIFEHRAVKGWKKKVPYHVKPSQQQVFFLPGLYSVAELPDKETGEMQKVKTFAIITRAANNLMACIHNDGDNSGRMPLFLPLQLAKKFLSEALNDDEDAYRQILNYEMPEEELTAHPVFTIRTPKPRPDGLSKDVEYYWDNLPPLGEGNP